MLKNLDVAIKENYKSLKEAAFAMDDMDLGNLSKIVNSEDATVFRTPTLKKISKAFPNYNIDWLLYNKGPKLKTKAGILNSPPEQLAKYEVIPQTNNERAGVPYYDVDFLGGFDLIHNNQTANPSFYIDFPPFNDCDAWINMTGKSMGPLIAHGDIVALKYQPDWDKFLLFNEIYAIVTNNGFRTIKMIKQGSDKDHLSLVPYNKGDEYEPQEIPKNMITHIFRVKGNIKKFF